MQFSKVLDSLVTQHLFLKMLFVFMCNTRWQNNYTTEHDILCFLLLPEQGPE